MEDHMSSGAQAAVLLRHPRQGTTPSRHQQQRLEQEAARARQAAGPQRDQSRFGRPSALTEQQPVPVVHTDQFRVIEPDGTEDPGASVDDGLAPDKRDTSTDK